MKLRKFVNIFKNKILWFKKWEEKKSSIKSKKSDGKFVMKNCKIKSDNNQFKLVKFKKKVCKLSEIVSRDRIRKCGKKHWDIERILLSDKCWDELKPSRYSGK